MNYVIAQTSGKQFVFKQGQWYDVDFIKNATLGSYVIFNRILFLRKQNQIQLGRPFLSESGITGKVLQQVKGKKITVLKTKPKKKYTRIKGHRQLYTRIRIENIQ